MARTRARTRQERQHESTIASTSPLEALRHSHCLISGVTWTLGKQLQIVSVAAAVLVASSTLFAQRPAVPLYSLTDLGTLGGATSEAAGLNLLGDVVGWSATAEGQIHAFLYRNGQMFDLGALPGGSDSFATAISDEGVVVGYGGINRYGPMFREFTQAFVWQAGEMRELGALYCPCTFNQRYGTSRALAISRGGGVVGDSRVFRGGLTHAFLWQANSMRDLGRDLEDTADSGAFGINDRDEVVGTIRGRAFLFRAGAREDLGVLPGHVTSMARSLNDIGQVVGDAFTAAGTASAFYWDRGQLQALATLPGDEASAASAINIGGQVVGRSGSADFSGSRAVLWQDGMVLDLNSLTTGAGWLLINATAINDIGQIAGVGIRNGQLRAFLLSPLGQRSLLLQ
jgi:probable HAF family extracellular repeat protein